MDPAMRIMLAYLSIAASIALVVVVIGDLIGWWHRRINGQRSGSGVIVGERLLRCFVNDVDIGRPEFIQTFGGGNSWVINWKLPEAGAVVLVGAFDDVIGRFEVPVGGLAKVTMRYINDFKGITTELEMVHTDWKGWYVVENVFESRRPLGDLKEG